MVTVGFGILDMTLNRNKCYIIFIVYINIYFFKVYLNIYIDTSICTHFILV